MERGLAVSQQEVEDDETTEGETADGGQRRVNSTIKFPYVGLDEVSGIAETMLNTYGGKCSMVQLASALGQTISSGAFRVKVTAAKMFGVVAGRGDNLTLTPLGSGLVDPTSRRKARVDAFLQVPLYAAMYEEATRQGGMMPGSLQGIEQMIVRLGVVPNQSETARLAFTRSARFAGFFEHGLNRLVLPALGAVAESDESADEQMEETPPPKPPTDPLPGKPAILVEVFKRLPNEGDEFGPGEREAWKALLDATLNVLYRDSAAPHVD
ncbi:MAG: hypothetical protein JWM89_612 [Acidimicrobiales bacterium]|nr:hypothetical protein [Acidimicrobiales bacterium]